MLVQQKIGNIASVPIRERNIDRLDLEWYETGKRILRRRTQGGKDIALRFLKESPAFTQGDILYEDEQELIVVELLACETIVIRPPSLFAVASVCYEIGNKHLPLFLEGEELLVPYDEPLFHQLAAGGYTISKEIRKLLYPLKTTVAAHAQMGSGLLSRILQSTNPEA
jgi:urease accessory protein